METQCWAMRSRGYTMELVRIVEAQMLKHNVSYPSTLRHDLKSMFSSSSYCPELDFLDLCSDELATLYMKHEVILLIYIYSLTLIMQGINHEEVPD